MRAYEVAAFTVIVMLMAPTQTPTTRGVENPRPRAAESPHKSVGSKITPECNKSIERGTQWLFSAMRLDGSLGTDIRQPADLGCTAIFGLTLLSQGNTPTAGPHCKELRRVLDAVLNQIEQLPEGETARDRYTLVQRKIGRHADLFLSALFLSQVLGEAPAAERDVRQQLEKVVGIICLAQRKDGTWGDDSWAPVLGTVLGWESLRVSSSAGLRVQGSARAAGDALLGRLAVSNRREQDWMLDFYKNASSIRVLYSLNYQHEPAFKDCVARMLKITKEDDRPFTKAGGEEFLAFFLVTECLLQGRNPEWESWYPTVRDKIIRVQNRDGSWSGHHCITARTFCTAAALLTLQAPNLYIPTSDL